MRNILLLIILIFNISILIAQPKTKKGKKFILNFYQEELKSENPFIYKKGISQDDIPYITDYLRKNNKLTKLSLVNNNIEVTDSIILTKKEILFIISNLEKQTDTTLWNDLNIPNSTVFNSKAIKEKDSIKWWSYFYSNYGKRFNMFSIPIFFRNNKFCAFYNAYGCGELCGQGTFLIYKKEKGKWIRYTTIYQWVS